MNKSKMNQPADENISHPRDRCGTPPIAIKVLKPYLDVNSIIWEPACGRDHIVSQLKGYRLTYSDILLGKNYFDYTPQDWGIQVTNPPFSVKYHWLKRAFELGKPFALLMPSESYFTKTVYNLSSIYQGLQLLSPSRRLNFDMPNKGYKGSAQFHSSWFCWQLNLPYQITRVEI